jgi:hypothetical protein
VILFCLCSPLAIYVHNYTLRESAVSRDARTFFLCSYITLSYSLVSRDARTFFLYSYITLSYSLVSRDARTFFLCSYITLSYSLVSRDARTFFLCSYITLSYCSVSSNTHQYIIKIVSDHLVIFFIKRTFFWVRILIDLSLLLICKMVKKENKIEIFKKIPTDYVYVPKIKLTMGDSSEPCHWGTFVVLCIE